MLDQGMRNAILTLNKKGLSIRRIARALSISRGTVRQVIRSGTAEVPRIEREEKAEPFRDRILELHAACKGNLVRVHEELVAEGCAISYPALTSFCRRCGITAPEKPAGAYHFEPGQEMQHDTSPHVIEIGGRKRRVQVASLVCCHSRVLIFQYYPVFTRFECKLFLTFALRYLGGSCATCMIDNTHVVVLRGTGADMVPVPEMEAFAEHFGFVFRAHEKGDANRSARVERPFHYIENNYEAGRTGRDFADWNRQAIEWCDQVNGTRKRHLGASPRELFALEQPHLKPLPEWIPPVYRIHQRIVGIDGYLRLHSNQYSVPLPVGRRVEVRETSDRIEVYEGPRMVAAHGRVEEPANKRVTDPAHRPPRGEGKKARLAQEEAALLRLAPELASYVELLRKSGRGVPVLWLRRLLSLVREYPREPLVAAIEEAARYGLFDLHRVERMVLKRIGEDFFFLDGDAGDDRHE
jgi:transposase